MPFSPTFPEPRPALTFRDWSSLHYHLLWAYQGPVAEVARVGVYSDTATSCWLIRAGEVRLKTGRQSVMARTGDWVFVASPERHQTFSEDARILSLHFELSWPGGEAVVDRTRNRVVPADTIPVLEAAAKPVVRALSRYFPKAGAFLPDQMCSRESYLKVQTLLPNLLNAYLDVQEQIGNAPILRNGYDARLLRCIAELDRIGLSEPIRQPELAARLGLSRSRLDALFVAEIGITPRRYLEQRRLNRARHLLTHTEKSVKRIAIELGFRHESHFCQWFKRLHGTRPSQLRPDLSAEL